MSETTARAPWCPRCGNAPYELYGYCPACNFNAEYRDSCWRAAGPWSQAVRAELARQALEMRAQSHGRYAKFDSQGHWTGAWNLDEAISTVTAEYEWLGAHPLRLPGEGA